MATSERRVSKGRQKVQMVRMEKQSNRLVTFSKRRTGLFKKASELCTLCGANAGVVVFSPGRKAFSFGHPSVDAIINRFLTGGDSSQNRLGKHPKKPIDDPTLARANMDLTHLNARIEATRRACDELLRERKAKGVDKLWWLGSIDELTVDSTHVQEMAGPLAELKEQVRKLALRWINAGIDIKSMSVMDVGNVIDQLGFPTNPLSIAPGGEGSSSAHGQLSLMVPNPIERNPNKQPPPVMIPTPTVRLPGPSIGMGSNGRSGLAPANPSLPIPPMSPMLNAIGGFRAPNMPLFQRVGNPIGGQLNLGLPMPPFNTSMGMVDPMTTPPNFQSFTSLLMFGASNNPQGENGASNNPVTHTQGGNGALNNHIPRGGNIALDNLVPQAQGWNGALNNPQSGGSGALNNPQSGGSGAPNNPQRGFGYGPKLY